MIKINSEKINQKEFEKKIDLIIEKYDNLDKDTIFKEQMLKNENLLKSSINIQQTKKYKIMKKIQHILIKTKLSVLEELGKKIFKKVFSSSPNAYIVEEFLIYEDKEFIKTCFKTLLKRDVHQDELNNYLSLLRSGTLSKTEILAQIRFSPEGEKIKVNILGLLKRHVIFKSFKIPILGKIIKIFFSFLRLPSLINRIQQLESKNFILQSNLSEIQNNFENEIKQSNKAISDLQLELNLTIEKLRKLSSEYILNKEITNNNIQNYIDDLVLTRRFITNTQDSLKKIIDETKQSILNAPSESIKTNLEKIDEKLLESFYIAFENRFRGSRKDIKQRQTYYLPYIKEVISTTNDEVLDVGCGRGEWLELLKENQISAKGVDLNSLMIDETTSLGLDGKVQDAIEYLKSLKDESLATVSGFHIVEHLPFEVLVSLLDESLRVLKKGGMIIFETPNPENIFVGSCSFYTDPTHINPIPPTTLQFLAQNRGFKNVQIHRLHPVKQPVYPDISNADDINTLIFASTKEQDYSIIGYK